MGIIVRTEDLRLKKILDLNKWQELQDSLALVTRMAIITVDYKGNPVSSHSYCTAFCSEVRSDPSLAALCQKCDARGGLEAVRQNEPYIYKCYFGIIDIAIPIIIDDKYIGAVMAGQIRLEKEEEEANTLEQVLTIPSDRSAQLKNEALASHYAQIPVLQFEEVKNISNMLSRLCNYIVEDALDKSLMFEVYEKTLSSHSRDDMAAALASYKSGNIEKIKNGISTALINTKIKEVAFNEALEGDSIIKPYFSYVIHHKSENISLKEAADLCNLSPGYFSRVFTKETGKTFTAYQALLKTEWAKQLLETTNMTILQISAELGFKDSGYFIKIFKKNAGITPLSYRNYHKSHSNRN